ncbi:hypothetical protein FT663_04054 [Candidozyma haemuli var. vulneris]|uniref:DNA-directed RNA polymerase subunit n=1 Tax=Candidozyma haemuli TaxID=45357 RepID=A0A2V1AKS6_9ASCO|nr:hypothetical protein CXQ85_001209 [[Candida] haemuloni]KAF3988308.1 hypothetical protein FT662_03504 [[Candida] haemuloni var. vulneris]KAF3988371.1 hypothetical protein FT663_04054 [[Candida] haemuloni var. vulneris]PVH18917.1 hypothetical protein CXQ85_001209 [[Candida] haemuloni]
MPAEVRESSPDVAEPALKKRNIAKTTNKVNDEGISECFKVVRTKFYLSLAPCHLGNPINGIKAQHLEPLVMKYHAKARGVVLSYFNVTLSNERNSSPGDKSDLIKVDDATPFAFLWATVDLLIWQPQPGDVLEGYIYMQTQSHIGLLIHDTFNASLKFKNLPQDWQFVPSQADEYGEEQGDSGNSKFRSYGYWTDENGTKVEGKIKFTVKVVNTSGRMVSLEGTLVSPESELDAQPISSERRKSSTSAAASVGANHLRFEDEDGATESPQVTEIPAAAADEVPSYDKTEENDDSSSDESSD